MSPRDHVFLAVAALAAGLVNALAGGGTLITFPALTAIGIPAWAANVTNTVALCPGFLGATLAQAGDLRGQRRRALRLAPAAAAGGLVGGLILLATDEQVFRRIVPWLILLAAGALALQERLRRFLSRRAATAPPRGLEGWAVPAVAVAAVYGGYFGAGMSVIVLAVLGLLLDGSLTRLNALKQLVALSANLAAAVLFAFSGKVVWSAALVMAAAAWAGGALGGRVAGRIPAAWLRRVVVTLGFAVGVIYLVRG